MTDERITNLRAEVLDQVAEKAERGFRDTRFDAMRAPGRRRGLVVGLCLILGVYAVSGHESLAVLQLPSLALYFAGVWLLRIVTRSIVDLPDEIVDERQRQVRGRVYRYSYLVVLSGGALVVAGAVFAAQWLDDGLKAAIPLEYVLHGSLVLFFGGMAVPNALFAWTEPEV